MMRARVARPAKPSGSFPVSAGRQAPAFLNTLLSYIRPVLRRTGHRFARAYSQWVQRWPEAHGHQPQPPPPTAPACILWNFFERNIMDKTTASTATGNPVQRGVESAGAALHSGIDKVADPARSAVDRASAAAHQGVDKLAGTATNVADRFADQTRRISEAPAHALDVSKSWVQERPLEAVGAALAIGFILGRLTAR